jgi:hypothetical protein
MEKLERGSKEWADEWENLDYLIHSWKENPDVPGLEAALHESMRKVGLITDVDEWATAALRS